MEIQRDWTDEDLVTVLQVLEDQNRARKGRG
jgi:hypothetical protein